MGTRTTGDLPVGLIETEAFNHLIVDSIYHVGLDISSEHNAGLRLPTVYRYRGILLIMMVELPDFKV